MREAGRVCEKGRREEMTERVVGFSLEAQDRKILKVPRGHTKSIICPSTNIRDSSLSEDARRLLDARGNEEKDGRRMTVTNQAAEEENH